ncbi:putative lipase [Fonsecaea pedrosoi]|nr:putative lipase [Fonsecaea pedrosoi]
MPLKNQQYSQFSAEFENFLKGQTEGNPLAALPLEEVREAVANAESALWDRDSEGIKWRELSISAPSVGLEVPIRIYEPSTSPQELPGHIAFMIHGGGWTLGGAYSDSFAVRALVRRLGMVVVTIGYHLAPENPFPVALNECCDALHWICTQSGLVKSPQQKLVMAGFSAGGNLSAAVTQWACRNRLARHIAAQVLFSPATCHYKQLAYASHAFNTELESINNATSPFLSPEQLKGFWDIYDAADGKDSRVSPLLAENLSTQPPTYIQVCGADPLRDEGLAYAERLQRAGVEVGIDIYAGMPHAYHSDLIAIPGRGRTMDDLVKWLSLVLSPRSISEDSIKSQLS